MARSSKTINKQYHNRNKQKDGIAPEFKKWLKEFNEEHKDVLEELAKR